MERSDDTEPADFLLLFHVIQRVVGNLDCGDRNNFLDAAVRIFGVLHLQADELKRRGGEIIGRGLDELDVGD